jgi:hypothetical protein
MSYDPSWNYAGSMALLIGNLGMSGCSVLHPVLYRPANFPTAYDDDARCIRRRSCGYCGRLSLDESREMCAGC